MAICISRRAACALPGLCLVPEIALAHPTLQTGTHQLCFAVEISREVVLFRRYNRNRNPGRNPNASSLAVTMKSLLKNKYTIV